MCLLICSLRPAFPKVLDDDSNHWLRTYERMSDETYSPAHLEVYTICSHCVSPICQPSIKEKMIVVLILECIMSRGKICVWGWTCIMESVLETSAFEGCCSLSGFLSEIEQTGSSNERNKRSSYPPDRTAATAKCLNFYGAQAGQWHQAYVKLF